MTDHWSHDTAQPLGDGRVQITAIPESKTALLTVCGKDHDLTPDECREMALRLLQAAERIESRTALFGQFSIDGAGMDSEDLAGPAGKDVGHVLLMGPPDHVEGITVGSMAWVVVDD